MRPSSRTSGVIAGLALMVACGGATAPGGEGGSSGGGSSGGGASGSPSGGSSSGGSSGSSFDCDSLCSLKYPPGCDPPEIDWQAQCEEGCNLLVSRTTAQCKALLDPLGDCVRQTFRACVSTEVCEPHAEAITRCHDETDPCAGANTFGMDDLGLFVIGHEDVCGCAAGLPAGTPCSVAEECEEHCCSCPTGSRQRGVQVCIRGTCAPRAVACSQITETYLCR